MLDAPSAGRWGPLVAIAIVGVAVAGFVTGTRPPTESGSRLAAAARSGTARTPNYADLRGQDFRVNAAAYGDVRERLARGVPDPMATVDAGPEDRVRALAERRANRAYDGAPPTIPHAVDQLEPSGCLVCHARGAALMDRLAPAMSHTSFANCTQCHVVAVPPGPTPSAAAAPNAFEGVAWGSGTRAWPGAPPTIPHPTHMRGECTSCHGAAGKLGLRSSHPWRASCQQCHAPSAALDQRPLARGQVAP